jgi:hypothetical protein
VWDISRIDWDRKIHILPDWKSLLQTPFSQAVNWKTRIHRSGLLDDTTRSKLFPPTFHTFASTLR